ncbi:hypothetical protein ACPV5X_13780 [Legionella pneumophila]|uniref:hypothetical protein n=1 Tax=Legionella pneumophila TaxID=446 RepID=UPI003C8E7F70
MCNRRRSALGQNVLTPVQAGTAPGLWIVRRLPTRTRLLHTGFRLSPTRTRLLHTGHIRKSLISNGKLPIFPAKTL